MLSVFAMPVMDGVIRFPAVLPFSCVLLAAMLGARATTLSVSVPVLETPPGPLAKRVMVSLPI